jgi:RNA polymerase sigma-70 factor (ECF subfamily)
MTPHATPPTVRIPAPEPATAVEELVQRHLRDVWRYLRTLGARPEHADDLAQEAFLVALRRGAAELAPAATATFLRRTARFLFLHHLRDRHRDAAFLDAVDELFAREEANGGGDPHLDRLRECLDALPPRSREAVQLWYGIDPADESRREHVAARLGLRPHGLKSLLQRVRRLLRDCMEKEPR